MSMLTWRLVRSAVLMLLATALLISPANAQGSEPALVKTVLTTGGLDWPAIPRLEEYISMLENSAIATTSLAQVAASPFPIATVESGVVHATLFWMDGCPHCDEVIKNVLPPLREKYARQLDIELVEVVSMDDVNHLYALGVAYNIPRDQVGVPLLIIGDQVLIGAEQIPARLPDLIEKYLTTGGVSLPDISAYYAPSDGSELAPAGRPDGFGLAIGVLIFMLLVLIYTLMAFFWKKLPTPSERWAAIALPLLALLGLVVAVYLSYVETQQVEAFCGPVGDCNTVQASTYARLFGVLPVGVLGAIGYLLILIAWGWNRRYQSRLATLVTFGMALLGTLFSIYLTYLELFVIQAVCLWCLTSAMIIALLLLFSLPLTTPIHRKVEKD